MRYNNESNLLIDDHLVAENFTLFFNSLIENKPLGDVAIPSGIDEQGFQILLNGEYKRHILDLINITSCRECDF